MTAPDLGVLVFVLVCIGSVCYIAGAVWAVWLDHEDATLEAEQRRYLETIHRTPAPMHERAAQGFQRHRAS